MRKKLAIVGATGLVGETVLKVFFELGLNKNFDLVLFSSEKSVGKRIYFNRAEYKLNTLDENFFDFKLDYAIFCTDEIISKKWVKKFINKGIIVIDNSSAFRLVGEIPLVVPEINFCDVGNSTLIANPNCSTIQLAIVLNKLANFVKIKKVIVSTYQSVSGAGKLALDDFYYKTNKVFPNFINENLIPFIGKIDDSGFCNEELKIINETEKILHSRIDIFANTVRVPIPYCHGESVYVEFEGDIDINFIKNNLSDDCIVYDETICLSRCVNTNKIYVSRLRQCKNNSLMFFEVADNLRRGAAFNALGILKKLCKLR